MVIIENIVIIAIVGFAVGYLIKLVWNQFNGKASGGCASCDSGGACGTQIPDFNEIKKKNS